MERESLTRRPMVRAALIVLLVVPLLVILERSLLEREGVVLESLWPAVILPIALTALSTALAFSILIARHGIALREAMQKLAAGDLTLGVPETAQNVDRDLLGLRDAFDTLRAELDRALRRLAHADAQRRRLFADLAHELATPASALLALGDTLSGDVPLDDAARARLLKNLESETLRLARLVEDIRDLAELDDPDVSFECERVDLAVILSGVIESLASGDGAKIETSSESVFVEVDAMRIDQVMLNLLRNARRHTPADRSIRVEVKAQGKSALIVVDDDGPGVPPEMLQRLGERLFRIDAGRDRRSGGHGLGLSIVRAILDRHGGTVQFEAGVSGGLRVTLSLPLID